MHRGKTELEEWRVSMTVHLSWKEQNEKTLSAKKVTQRSPKVALFTFCIYTETANKDSVLELAYFHTKFDLDRSDRI